MGLFRSAPSEVAVPPAFGDDTALAALSVAFLRVCEERDELARQAGVLIPLVKQFAELAGQSLPDAVRQLVDARSENVALTRRLGASESEASVLAGVVAGGIPGTYLN